MHTTRMDALFLAAFLAAAYIRFLLERPDGTRNKHEDNALSCRYEGHDTVTVIIIMPT